jgi:hypothetical protein
VSFPSPYLSVVIKLTLIRVIQAHVFSFHIQVFSFLSPASVGCTLPSAVQTSAYPSFPWPPSTSIDPPLSYHASHMPLSPPGPFSPLVSILSVPFLKLRTP